jgi:hypothetical protein
MPRTMVMTLGALTVVLTAGYVVTAGLVHQLSVFKTGPTCIIILIYAAVGDHTVAAFAARLMDAVELDTVRNDLATVVNQALEPTHVSVWITRHN